MDADKKAEVTMSLFRLARSGNYQTAASLRDALKEMYPTITKAEVSEVIGDLARTVVRM